MEDCAEADFLDVVADGFAVDKLGAPARHEPPTRNLSAGLDSLSGNLLCPVAEIIDDRAGGQELAKFFRVSDHRLKVESNFSRSHRLSHDGMTSRACVCLGTPAAVLAWVGSFAGVVELLDHRIDHVVRFLVREADRLDLAQVAEEQVACPIGGKVGTHEPEGVCCHLLAVVAPHAGLEIEVGEPRWNNRICSSGQIENLDSAVVLTSQDPLAPGHRTDHRDSPGNRGDFVGTQLVGQCESLLQAKQLGTKCRIKQSATLSRWPSHGIALVTWAGSKLWQIRRAKRTHFATSSFAQSCTAARKRSGSESIRSA